MNTHIQATILWILLVFTCTPLLASHNLAGQITCKYIGINKYELLLTTYTDPSGGTDRCASNIEIWNAAGVQIAKILDIPRENGLPDNSCTVPNAHKGVTVYQAVKENLYRTSYTFPGPGYYTIRYFDPYRRADIANIDNPGAVTFYLETKLFIINPLAGGNNNTPVLLNRPLDEACIGKIWTHNPGGYDPDGDSLVYSLMPSLQYDSDNGPFSPIPVPGYAFPDAAVFGNSSMDIHPQTGVITWITPQKIGVFNVAFKVSEYRNGVLLGHLIRDMVIIVKPCNNNPPVIQCLADTCVHINDTLRFTVKAWDPDSTDSVYLALNNANIGNNGPFAVPNSATLSFSNPMGATQLPVSVYSDTIKGKLEWITVCDNIRKVPYQVDFYAHDNYGYIGMPGLAMLSANKAVSVHVIPPPPSHLTANRGNKAVQLSWTPSTCSNTLGYKVYRKLGNATFYQDTICCDLSPSQAGFQLIKYVTGWTTTHFEDSLLDVPNLFGQSICYVVTAMYGKESYKPDIESCATNTDCVAFKSDTLYLTNVSVAESDAQTGKIFVAWSKPDSIDAFFPPPYHYVLYRANNNQYPAITVAQLPSLDDTTFTDDLLNTDIRGYNYRVEVIDGTGKTVVLPGSKNRSSSIYLQLTADVGLVDLNWQLSVEWQNTKYEIYRKENLGTYSLIATIAATSANSYHYQDAGLDPNTRYCYFIRSTGSYNIAGIKPLLINDSNEDCAYPRSDNPPCNPQVAISGNCYDFTHTLHISKETTSCDDLTGFITVHYGTTYSGPFVPVLTIPYQFVNDTTFSINYAMNPSYYAGCYTVTATNVYGITSAMSAPICVDYCPEFALPNTFTPNSDGYHEEFIPMLRRAILIREVEIYDRWGVLLHHDNSSDIFTLWNGRLDANSKDAPFGIYYYVIHYEEQKLAGNTPKIVKGWVFLVR